MIPCHCCGEEKKSEEFYKLPYFTHYQRKKVVWCRDCQKMYIEYKKLDEKKKRLETIEGTFCVSFS